MGAAARSQTSSGPVLRSCPSRPPEDGAKPRRPWHHQGLRGPSADCPGPGWQGGRGGRQRKQGAEGQGHSGRPPHRPFGHPQSACLAEAPGDEAPVLAHSQGLGAWEGPLGRGAWEGPLGRGVWARPACGRGLRVGGASGAGREGCSAQALLCAHRCRRPVKGVAPSLHRGPWSACDGRSLNLRPSTPPWEGPEASPGSGAALQCSPGDTLPGPRGFHHNCLAGG